MKRSLQLLGFACFGILLSGSLVQLASAQQPGGGRPGGGRGFGGGFGLTDTMLIGNEKVQKELELVEDQVSKINKLREESQAEGRKLFEGIRDLPEDQRRAKFEEMNTKREESQKALRAKINEVLLPDQRDRLKELVIQAQGTGALNNEETAAALKITDEQKKKIETIREEAGPKMREAMGTPGQGGLSEEARAKLAEIRKESSEKVLAVLTTEQKAQFEKMKGEKSDIDFTELFRSRGRGQGGGRPGGNPPSNN